MFISTEHFIEGEPNSKTKGILYHHGGRLNDDKGWSETESDNPPDKFWEGEIENKLPNGFGTFTHTNGTTYFGQYVDGQKVKRLGLYSMGVVCWYLER